MRNDHGFLKRFITLCGFTMMLQGIASVKVPAQNSNHVGLFPTIDHSGVISDKWSYSFYYFSAFNLSTYMVNGEESDPGYFIFYAEQAMTYKPLTSLSLTGSYVYERLHPVDKENYRNENRLYLQATWVPALKRLQVRNRLRYDARFIQDQESVESAFTTRLRYLLGIIYPLKAECKFYLNAYNEMFFNTYQKAEVTYAENWAYVGIGLKTKSVGAWEMGPLYIFWVNNKERTLSNFYFLQLTWITQVDFRRNK